MIETKYRGPLNQKQIKILYKYLHHKGRLIESSHEDVVFFDTSIFPEIGDFKTGFSRVSVKSNKYGASLRIKDGNPSNTHRDEIGVSIKKRDCGNVVYILNRLGLKYGFYRPAFREKFLFKGIYVSIKTKCVMGDHFEIELPNLMKVTDPAITDLLQKCSLSFWSKNKYQQLIHERMRKFPAQNIYELHIWDNLV